jgi:glycosyltransferase involved in cell wall biosynthesis
LLIVGVPVIKCFLCIGISNFGINQAIVIGEIGSSGEVKPFKSFFGLVLLESMKYRIPIITTNCDGPKEILQNEHDCLMLDLANKNQDLPNQIASAILKLINDKDLANELVENAFNRLQKRYSMEILERNLADLFKIEKL